MKKKLYSEKYGFWIKLPRKIYKRLARVLAEEQIAEFYISYSKYLDNPDFTVQQIILNMVSFTALVYSDDLLESLNRHTDSEGNVNWSDLLKEYNLDDQISEVY